MGLFEMKVCVDRTGGTVVLGDSFSMHIFQQSFKKMFEPDDSGYLRMGFNAKINLLCSREVRGPVLTLRRVDTESVGNSRATRLRRDMQGICPLLLSV